MVLGGSRHREHQSGDIMSNLRFAVAGWKHFHIREFVKGMLELPGAEFVGVADDDTELRDSLASEFGVPAYATVEALVESAEPEVVGVADVNAHKAHTICRLTSLGCHVLADKPLVTTLRQLDEVESAAAKTGRQIGLMLTERYHGPTRAVREQLLAGHLGTLVSFVGLSPHKLRPEGRPAWMFDPEKYGGVLNDLGIHNADLCRWMWRAEPVAVTASEGCLRFRQFAGFTDHAEVFLQFDDSSTAMFRADWLTPEAFATHGDGRHFFEGTEATVEVVAAPDIHTLGQGHVTMCSWNEPPRTLEPSPPSATLYQEFVALCRGTQSAELLPDEGFRSTRLTLYAREAARTGTRIDLRGKL